MLIRKVPTFYFKDKSNFELTNSEYYDLYCLVDVKVCPFFEKIKEMFN